MKKLNMIIVALLFSLTFIACSDDDSPIEVQDTLSPETQAIKDVIDSYPVETLSQSETNGILFMREEEKLARDVYLHLYDKYGLRIFNNIPKSEQTHMDALKMLIDKYGLADPVTNNDPGVFQNVELASLYSQLISAGDASLVEALKIGATIEDLDIRDLIEYKNEVNNQDIIYVYDNLTKGSRNHLRAFYPQVLSNGGTYDAQFISQELFDEIINSSQERGSW